MVVMDICLDLNPSMITNRSSFSVESIDRVLRDYLQLMENENLIAREAIMLLALERFLE
jgi:hypothetical protein